MSDPSEAMVSPAPIVQPAPPSAAPYHPPPNVPPPAPQVQQVTDGRAAASALFAILGLIFSIPLGLPGMIAGPIAYFLAKDARQRISESNGRLGGGGAATVGRILGIVAFVVGSLFTLGWLIVIFNALLDTSGGGT